VGNDLAPMITAIAAVGLLSVLMRWIFRPTYRSGQPARIDASDSAELGLLTVVATNLSRIEALRARGVLGEAGLRSSMSRRRDGNLDVLVFHADADRARDLLHRIG
jgi:hypothetical protein